MSPTRRQHLAELSQRWALDADGPWTVDALRTAFGRDAPRLLDVGPGRGESTLAWAQDHPDHDVVAVELHLPGLLHLLRQVDALGIETIRAVEADVTAVVAAAEPGTFTQIRVLFPDPWPKRRHVRRRLVDEVFVAQATDLLVVGGTLHVATDWADYAEQMRRCLATDPRLHVEVDTEVRIEADVEVEVEPRGDPSDSPAGSEPVPAPARAGETARPGRPDRPDRPVTAYERRGLDAGRTITDLVARRTR